MRDRGGEEKKGEEKARLNWPVQPRWAVMVWACQTLCLNSWPGLTCIPCIRPTTTNSSVLFGSFQCQAWESCATHISTPLHSSGGLSVGDGYVGLRLWHIWLHHFRLRWQFLCRFYCLLIQDNFIVALCPGSRFRHNGTFKFKKLKMPFLKLHAYLGQKGKFVLFYTTKGLILNNQTIHGNAISFSCAAVSLSLLQ